MNLTVILSIIGYALRLESILLLLPAVCAVVYGESITVFLIPAALAAGAGALCRALRHKDDKIESKEGFVATGLTWIALSLVGMLPFMLCGSVTNVFDALFETVSGFTTTGSSILTEVESLPKSVLFWRSFMHWIGGMGILVFMSALMKFTAGSQIKLVKAESTGPVISKMMPKSSDTAKVLYIIYSAMTVVTFIVLLVLRMPVFDALCLTFGAAGTGGFSVLNSGVASYTIAQQLTLTVSMICFGINFNFYFLLLLKKWKLAFGIEEVRAYLLIMGFAVLLVTMDLFLNGVNTSVPMAFHNASFHAASLMTTTGYAFDNINLWPEFSQIVMVLLMMCGACAGSTGGGFKISRLLIMGKAFRRNLQVHLTPGMVKKVHIDGKVIDEEVINATGTYTFAYILIMAVSILLVSLDDKNLETCFTAVIATFNNIGPGLGEVGTVGNFSGFSNFSKLILTFDMLIGRLEIYPILALFFRKTWKKF